MTSILPNSTILCAAPLIKPLAGSNDFLRSLTEKPYLTRSISMGLALASHADNLMACHTIILWQRLYDNPYGFL